MENDFKTFWIAWTPIINKPWVTFVVCCINARLLSEKLYVGCGDPGILRYPAVYCSEKGTSKITIMFDLLDSRYSGSLLNSCLLMGSKLIYEKPFNWVLRNPIILLCAIPETSSVSLTTRDKSTFIEHFMRFSSYVHMIWVVMNTHFHHNSSVA